jgi:hypothetical protein
MRVELNLYVEGHELDHEKRYTNDLTSIENHLSTQTITGIDLAAPCYEDICPSHMGIPSLWTFDLEDQ